MYIYETEYTEDHRDWEERFCKWQRSSEGLSKPIIPEDECTPYMISFTGNTIADLKRHHQFKYRIG